MIILALAVIGVASAGFAAYRAWAVRQESEAFLRVNHVSQLLLQSTGQWAIERGLTNPVLKSPEAVSAERRAEIAKMRAASDEAFRDAARLVREIPAMKAAERNIADAENAYRAFEAFRGKVDQNLARQGAEREAVDVLSGDLPAGSN